MNFNIHDHVQVVDYTHPHYGEIGIIVGTHLSDYGDQQVLYFHVDIGTEIITVTAEQISNKLPPQQMGTFQGIDSLIHGGIDPGVPDGDTGQYLTYTEYMAILPERNARSKDRMLSKVGGKDFEPCDLPLRSNNIDGQE